MPDHAEFIPDFKVHIEPKSPSNSPKSRSNSFVMSCRIIGESVGFRTTYREFANIDAIATALEKSGIVSNRYEDAINALDAHAVSDFAVSLNEAQRLAVIQTDSTE